MDKKLSIDEFDALEQIGRLTRNAKPTACVNRNAKRLCGIKFAAYRKDGQLELTEEGRSVVFSKHCIDGLRAVQLDSATPLDAQVFAFLSKKSYITSDEHGTQITQRGLECLADIDAQQKS
jgi:hypothetical protein